MLSPHDPITNGDRFVMKLDAGAYTEGEGDAKRPVIKQKPPVFTSTRGTKPAVTCCSVGSTQPNLLHRLGALGCGQFVAGR